MLDGVKIFDLKKFPDERGSFTEIMRTDWKEILGDEYFGSNVHLTDMYDYIPFAEREKLKHLGKESL